MLELLPFADAVTPDIDNQGVVRTMVLVTAAVLIVIGVSIYYFAKWSAREGRRRQGEIDRAEEFGDALK